MGKMGKPWENDRKNETISGKIVGIYSIFNRSRTGNHGPVGLMIYLFKIVVFRSQSVKLPASILERTNFWGIMVRY